MKASASNEATPLHLTEANKETIRALVRLISPRFEEAVWDKVRVVQEEEEKHRLMNERFRQAAKSMTAAMAQNIYNTSPTVQSLFQNAAASKAMGLQNALSGTTGTVYVPTGTGFTVYDAEAKLMGLGKAGSGWEQ